MTCSPTTLFSMSLIISSSIRGGLIFIKKVKSPSPAPKRNLLKNSEMMDVIHDSSASCPFQGYICNPSGDDLIERADAAAGVITAKDCEKLCVLNKLCRIFTFFNYRNKPVCYFLQDCKEKVRISKPNLHCLILTVMVHNLDEVLKGSCYIFINN